MLGLEMIRCRFGDKYQCLYIVSGYRQYIETGTYRLNQLYETGTYRLKSAVRDQLYERLLNILLTRAPKVALDGSTASERGPSPTVCCTGRRRRTSSATLCSMWSGSDLLGSLPAHPHRPVGHLLVVNFSTYCTDRYIPTTLLIHHLLLNFSTHCTDRICL